MHVGRDGLHITMPDPESLEPTEREDFIELLKARAALSSD